MEHEKISLAECCLKTTRRGKRVRIRCPAAGITKLPSGTPLLLPTWVDYSSDFKLQPIKQSSTSAFLWRHRTYVESLDFSVESIAFASQPLNGVVLGFDHTVERGHLFLNGIDSFP